ncbi:hypothetical protein PIB30_020640 [Stylosanthes scabra]|uniref:CWF21 domain-containing protein n=1 Tax=Stylosanthes scabra TaxID=79078 RepID=A0ABU6U8I2_9FABA|nr:hypothetical protein [Stylosanthes scabra]
MQQTRLIGRLQKGGGLHCGKGAKSRSLAEVFKNTHTRKRNKEEWVDERSERLNASQQSAHEGNDLNNPAVVDPDEVWRDVAKLEMNATVQEAREELLREREEFRKMRDEMSVYYVSVRDGPNSGVGLTSVAAPAAQPNGDGGRQDQDDADDYQDP